MSRPRKHFGGYCPVPHEKSVVLGGGLVLFPLANPADVAATLHLYSQAIWDYAYREGREDAQQAMKEAIGL